VATELCCRKSLIANNCKKRSEESWARIQTGLGKSRFAHLLTFNMYRTIVKKRRWRMSRALALARSVALLWSGVGYGLSDICCCTMGPYTSTMERTGGNCVSRHDHVGGILRASDHHPGCQCLGLSCEAPGVLLRLFQFVSPLPYNHVATAQMGLLNVEGLPQACRSLSVRIHSFSLYSLSSANNLLFPFLTC
jgi:hypothetical protein